MVAIAVVGVFQLAFTYTPLLQTFFDTRAIGIDSWTRILLVGLCIFILVEIEKTILRRLRKRAVNPI